MRIGIFGGSFNPPHPGHVQAIAAAQRELALDRVLLIPAATPPHKTLPPHSPDADTRMALTRLAAADLPWAEVSDIELCREGPSYTVDTLRELQQAYPGDELVLILGTDMFLTLHKWYHADEICRMAHIAYVARTDTPQAEIDAQVQRLTEQFRTCVTVLHNDVLELSSTTIRRMIAFDCTGEILDPAVAAEIRRLGLYTQPESLRHLPLPALEQTCVELLDAKRVAHVLGCRDTAVELARRFGCSETDALRGALLHDVTKALPAAQQLQLCRKYDTINYDSMLPQLRHAVTGALVAAHIFGESEAVCESIRWHTTGKPDMTALEKILYLADMIEPNRDFDTVDSIRACAERDLDEAVWMALTRSAEWISSSSAELSPETIAARDWLGARLSERSRK